MPAQRETANIQARRGTRRREPEKDLFSWSSPARPFKKRDREFWVSIIAIATIVGFILFIIEKFSLKNKRGSPGKIIWIK